MNRERPDYFTPQMTEIEMMFEQAVLSGSGDQIDDMPYGDNNWETLE